MFKYVFLFYFLSQEDAEGYEAFCCPFLVLYCANETVLASPQEKEM